MIRALVVLALLLAACNLPSDIVGPTDPTLPPGWEPPPGQCPTPEEGSGVEPPC